MKKRARSIISCISRSSKAKRWNMELFELLQRGYFPKELPPAFNTYKFALKASGLLLGLSDMLTNPQNYVTRLTGEIEQDYNQRKNEFKKRYGEMASSPAHYSIEKSDVSRRVVHIPNPLNYLKLAEVIAKNESKVFRHIPSSAYSNSKARYASDISERCIVPRGLPISQLQREKLKASMSKRYEIKLDVANFYPSVYTHSISWAFLGRERAKEIWGIKKTLRVEHFSTSEIELYDLGDEIDKSLRNCNECQTHGILVGPDVSFLIGELIMSRIDACIADKYPDLRGFRYYDDYTFYVDNEKDADEIYQTLQADLRLYGLEINEAKFQKRKSPCAINEDHAREIGVIKVAADKPRKKDGIIRLFDLMWKCAEIRPEKTLTIFKYGLRLLINQHVYMTAENKGVYEPLLYKTAVVKSSVLALIYKILNFSVEPPTKDLLRETVYAIFANHVPYAQENEAAWALWICKKYEIEIEKDMVCKILNMGSTVCSIILLDILHNKQPDMLIDKEVKNSIDNLKAAWNGDSLYGEDWLLLYEASEQGWIPNDAIITADPFFKMLHDDQIKFYDPNVAADYSSYDYIETLPYDFYPSSTRTKATKLRDQILGRIKNEAFDRFYDEEWGEEISKDDLRDSIDAEIEDMDFEGSLLNQLLNPVFRGEDIDEDRLVKEYIERIELYREY